MVRLSIDTKTRISGVLLVLLLLCCVSPVVMTLAQTSPHKTVIETLHKHTISDHHEHKPDKLLPIIEACCADEDTLPGSVIKFLVLLLTGGLMTRLLFFSHKSDSESNVWFKRGLLLKPLFPPNRILHCVFTI